MRSRAMGYNPEVHGPLSPKLTAVWVRLDQICIRPDDAQQTTIPEGLDMVGQVRGLLSGWHRTVKGDWLGLVNFYVPYADGRRDRLFLTNQLVPAYAMHRRHDHRPI